MRFSPRLISWMLVITLLAFSNPALAQKKKGGGKQPAPAAAAAKQPKAEKADTEGAAKPGTPQAALGNIFLDSEPVVLNCPASGDSVDYTVKDFWDQTVASGKTPVAGGMAQIKPEIKKRGYYELNVNGKELTFAIIAPVNLKTLANSPYNACVHFSQGWNTDLIPLLARVGVSEVRDNVGWGSIEKQPGSYDYAGKSEWIAACKQAGIRVVATGGCMGNKLYGGGFPETPDTAKAYGKFTADMGRHYGDALSGLELWNEFNGSWGPKHSSDRPKCYADMIKLAYPIIKQGCPGTPVLGCAAVVMPIPYLEGIFKNGGLACMDGVVIHPYMPSPEGLWRDVGAVEDLIKKYNNGKPKPIYATEYGWGTNFGGANSLETIARNLVRGSVILVARNVKSMHWYQFQDEKGFMGQGLVHLPDDARGKYSPTPAVVAYATLVRTLGAATYDTREAAAPYTSAWVFRFKEGGNQVRACWAANDQTPQIAIETDAPMTQIDIMGNESALTPQNGKIVLTLNETPVFLKGNAKSVTELPGSFKVIANSLEDFGETQGINNWQLGNYAAQGAKLPPSINPAGFQTGNVETTTWGYEWHCGSALIKQGALVAEGKSWPTQRWVSPVDGKVTLLGYFEVRDKKNPVTVGTAIYVDGKSVFAKDLNMQTEKIELTVDVKKGSTIDFLAGLPGGKGRARLMCMICVPNRDGAGQ